MNIAEIRNLSKRYPSFNLKDISFSLEKEELQALLEEMARERLLL